MRIVKQTVRVKAFVCVHTVCTTHAGAGLRWPVRRTTIDDCKILVRSASAHAKRSSPQAFQSDHTATIKHKVESVSYANRETLSIVWLPGPAIGLSNTVSVYSIRLTIVSLLPTHGRQTARRQCASTSSPSIAEYVINLIGGI